MIEIILLLLAGCGSGMINAVAGGGNLLVFPVFLGLGLSPFTAAVTGSLVVSPASAASAYGYRKDLAELPRKYFWLLLPSLFGAAVGVYLLHSTPHSVFEKLLPWLVLFAVVLFIFQPQLHKFLHRPAKLRFGSPLFLVSVGLMFACIYGGYFGAGVGFLILVLCGYARFNTIYQMMAFKSALTSGIALMTVISFGLAGEIAWKYGAVAACGAVVGGYLGARWSHRISPYLVRLVVAIIGTSVVVITFLRAYS